MRCDNNILFCSIWFTLIGLIILIIQGWFLRKHPFKELNRQERVYLIYMGVIALGFLVFAFWWFLKYLEV